MMKITGRATFATMAVVTLCCCVPSAAEAGAKLIQMKNGRILRAQSVRTEGTETVATLEGGNTMAFPTLAIAGVEDDIAGTQMASAPLNVIRSGREGGGGGGFAPPQAAPEPIQEEPVEVPAEVPPAAQEAVGNPGGIVVDEQPRTPAGPPNAAPGPGARNRRVGRLGFKARPADN
jgi:hypothetical protein